MSGPDVRTPGTSRAFAGQTTADSAIVADMQAARDARCKAFLTLQAKAALAAIRVDQIEADDGSAVWCVSRWNLTRACSTLAEVRALLERMGAKA